MSGPLIRRFQATLAVALLGAGNASVALAQVPTGGHQLVGREDIKALEVGKSDSGESLVVPVEGQSFKSAIHAIVEKRGNSWDLEARVLPKGSFAKGDAVLVHLWARTLKTNDESGQGLIAVSFGETTAPWTAQFGRTFSGAAPWQEFYVRGNIQKDYAPGQLALKLSFGQAAQIVEVGGVEIVSYGQGADLAKIPETRTSYAGREVDAPWRAQAQERIRTLRMAPLVVQVIDRSGKTLSGASVHAVLKKHAFTFSCAIDASTLVSDDKPENEAYRRRLLEIFNGGSFYNNLKWEAWTGEWGTDLSRETTMKGLEWLKAHDMTIRGHNLVWPSFHNMVGYVKALKGKATPEELQRLVLSHIDDITSATAPYVSEWDVVNEPRDNHDMMDLAGKQVLIDYFQRAHNRLPKAQLVLNDYSILSPLSDSPSQQEYEDYVRYLINNGAPIDGFGFQGHFGSTVPSPMRLLKVLDRFAALHRSIRVTEFTVEGDDEKLKGDFTRDLMTVLFSHPAVTGFQLWGMDEVANKDGSLTAIGEAVRQQINERWHTDIKATTDAGGTVADRGFLGQYDVTVTLGERTLTVPFELRQDSQPMIVTLP